MKEKRPVTSEFLIEDIFEDGYSGADETLRLLAELGTWQPVVDEEFMPEGGMAMDRSVTWPIADGEVQLTQTLLASNGTDSMHYYLTISRELADGRSELTFSIAPEHELFLVIHDDETFEGAQLQAYDGQADGQMLANSFSPTVEDMAVFRAALQAFPLPSMK